MGFQVVKSKYVKRTKHVWYRRLRGEFKCVLCGAVARKPPESDDHNWVAECYEPLTDEERAMCPNSGRPFLD